MRCDGCGLIRLNCIPCEQRDCESVMLAEATAITPKHGVVYELFERLEALSNRCSLGLQSLLLQVGAVALLQIFSAFDRQNQA